MPSNKLLRAKHTASSDSASSAAEIDTEQVNEINRNMQQQTQATTVSSVDIDWTEKW